MLSAAPTSWDTTAADRTGLLTPPVPSAPATPLRYLLYSHDAVGLGHTCRNLAIARALVREDPDATVLLASGTDEILQLGLPERVEVLKLPGLRKVASGTYASRRLLVPPPDIHRLRAGLLLESVSAFQPDVLLVDKHHLGAGGELRHVLAAQRRRGAATALGLRDILDAPDAVRAEWADRDVGRCIADLYDRVLIYGQQGVFDPVTEYGLPPALQARSVFCGYVTRDTAPLPPRRPGPARSRPVVLATAGGGEDGATLLAAFLEASRGAPWRAVAVTGPQAPDDAHSRLGALARESGATLHRFLPDLRSRLGHADVLVSMGGYNTLAEAVGLGLPVVCVPRIHPRREQLVRAEAFQRLGLLECLHPGALAPASLREAIRRALRRSRADLARRCASQLHLDGALQAAVALRDLARATVPASTR